MMAAARVLQGALIVLLALNLLFILNSNLKADLNLPHDPVSARNQDEEPGVGIVSTRPIHHHATLEPDNPQVDVAVVLQVDKLPEPDLKDESCHFPLPFAYVRTHRTYNSVLTNIFKRIITKKDLNIPIPKQSVYLGWPYADSIFNSFTHRYPSRKKLDALCCGTFVYKAEYIDEIVPNAAKFTIFRNPTAQFMSTFEYWNVLNLMLKAHYGQEFTLETFLSEPQKYTSLVNEIETAIIFDITAFDFGLGNSATMEDVDRTIQHLETFQLVMISDYMYESLVLLKRSMCLKLEDVVFIDQRQGRGPRFPANNHLTPLIEKLNWKSTKMYNHFNASLWRKISLQSPDFFEEVATLRKMVEAESRTCARFSSIPGDTRVQKLLTEDLPELDRNCLTKGLMDDEFIDYFRGIQSKVHKLGLDEFKCTNQQPDTKIVWVKTHKTGSSTMTNLFHRFGFVHNLQLALPKDDAFYHWPFRTGIPESVIYPKGKGPNSVKFDMLCSGHTIYNRDELDVIVPNAKYITLLRHPVSHFLSSWSYWNMAEKSIRGSRKSSMDVQEFLRNPDSSILQFNFPDRRLIHNGMATDLGLVPDNLEESLPEIMKRFSDPTTGFSVVLINEYLDESLVVMRHKLCWDLEDVIPYALKVSPKKKAALSDAQKNAILKFNHVDAALYNHFNKTLWEEIAKIPNFQKELDALKIVRESMISRCETFSVPDHRGRYILMTEPHDSTLAQCVRFMIDSVEFARVFKSMQGYDDKECIRLGTFHNIGLLKPHYISKPGNVLTNVIYRRAIMQDSSVALAETTDDYYTTTYTVYSLIYEHDELAAYIPDGYPSYNFNFLSSFSRASISNFVVVVPDPVDRFLLAWNDHNIDQQLREMGLNLTILEALKTSDSAVARLLAPLKNTFAKDFNHGALLPGTNTTIDVKRDFRSPAKIAYAIPATRMEEALVYLSRLFCWDLSEMVYIQDPLPFKSARAQLDQATRRAIENFNLLDTQLFESVDSNFVTDISFEYKFADELQKFRSLVARANKECAGYKSMAQAKLLKLLMQSDAPTDVRCTLLLMHAETFETYVRRAYQFKKKSYST